MSDLQLTADLTDNRQQRWQSAAGLAIAQEEWSAGKKRPVAWPNNIFLLKTM